MAKTICVLCFILLGASTAYGNEFYSPGGWSTLHQDGGNRRAAVQASVLSKEFRSWHQLAGASILAAPTTSPDGTTLYVTTAQSEGKSNLHALSVEGDILWESTPWSTPSDGVDPCAFLSSPIIDSQGDIYIGDCNQIFAFKDDGQLKWVTELPIPRPGDWVAVEDHPVNSLVTAVFTAEGHVLGVTTLGDVVVVDRAEGKTINESYRLPGLIPPQNTTWPMPDSIFGDGLIDPRFRGWVWEVLFGGSVRSANTPAVAKSGRVYVVGSSPREGQGALYALDIVRNAAGIVIEEAFVTDIGLGSGSSPALSHTEKSVYVSDEDGWLYSVDAQSGAVEWKTKTSAAPGAAGVGMDGTVYALQSGANVPPVVAISPDGTPKWESDFSALTAQMPSSFFFGDPVVVGNGNPTITGDAIVVPVIYGYEIPTRGKFIAPVRSAIAAVDTVTGKAIGNILMLPDESDGITVVLPNGTIINSMGAATSSAISPIQWVLNLLLPRGMSVLEPRGGLHVASQRTAN